MNVRDGFGIGIKDTCLFNDTKHHCLVSLSSIHLEELL